MPEEVIMHEIRLSGKAYKYLMLSFSVSNIIRGQRSFVGTHADSYELERRLETFDELSSGENLELLTEIVKAMPVTRPHLWGDPKTSTFWDEPKKDVL